LVIDEIFVVYCSYGWLGKYSFEGIANMAIWSINLHKKQLVLLDSLSTSFL
jgi:hypothetical protein